MFNRTGILFARPSFLEGFARPFDLGNNLNLYNESLVPEDADIRALRADWDAVGDDLREAIKEEMQTPTTSNH
jgi:hypothetical protein